jgi:hypothetical protein
MFLQHLVNEGNWKAYNVEIAPFDPGNPPRCHTLDCISACLVHWLATSHVVANFGFRNGLEANARDLRAHIFELTLAAWADQANAGNDTMHFPGELPEHANRVGFARGLLEHVIIDEDDGVRAENEKIGMILRPLPDGTSFVARQPFGIFRGRLRRQSLFWDVGRLHCEWDSSGAQQFLSAGRSRGKNKRHAPISTYRLHFVATELAI